MPAEKSKSVLTRVLTIVAVVLVVVAGAILLLKRNIFAEIATTKATSLGIYQANGSHRMTFSTWANFSLASSYVWWDCQGVQATDDTFTELVARCGKPAEKSGTTIIGDSTKGARMRLYNNVRGAYKVTLPAKTNAKAVYLATGTDGTNMVKTQLYNTAANRNYTPIPGTNSIIRIDNTTAGVRYLYEYLTAPDGDQPLARYYLWYNCNFSGFAQSTPVSELIAKCGNPSQVFQVPGDRLIHVVAYGMVSGPQKAIIVAQEKKCTAFSYTDDSSCSYSNNAFAGAHDYVITPKTPTPVSTTTVRPSLTPIVTSTTKPSPTPTIQSPTQTPTPGVSSTSTTAVKPSPTSTTTGPTLIDYNFTKGFNVFGGTTAIAASKFASNSTTLYKFDGVNNRWVKWPGSESWDAQFTTQHGGGYYVYSPAAKTFPLLHSPLPTTSYTLTKGWNLLYNVGNKTLDTLKLTYGNQTNKTAQELIDNSTIHSRIFIIENPQSTQACGYFKVLWRATTMPDCANNALGTIGTLQTGKLFWVYVY